MQRRIPPPPSVLLLLLSLEDAPHPEESHWGGHNHLHIRGRLFPCGDGQTSLFHNPHTNAQPEEVIEARKAAGEMDGPFRSLIRGMMENPEVAALCCCFVVFAHKKKKRKKKRKIEIMKERKKEKE